MTPAWLTLAACAVFAPDPDHDGLSSRDEADLGTDPRNPDTDGDGLEDGAEVAHGADPLITDTDGDGLLDGDDVANGADPKQSDTDDDGYLDPWEVTEGTDPADPDSRIYTGNWPYNPNRKTNRWKYGLPNWKQVDQFGEIVRLHDLAGHGVDILLNPFLAWDRGPNNLAAWLAGEDDDYYTGLGPDVRSAVQKGDIIWLSIIVRDWYDYPPTQETAELWADMYPNEMVPVLADEDAVLEQDFLAHYYQNGFLFDENLEMLTTSGYVEDALVEAQARL